PAPGSTLDLQLAAFIGPRWERYRQKFAPFYEDGRFQPTWNWAAALFTGGWFLYRKLYVPFVLYTVLPQLAFSLLWGDAPMTQTVPNPKPGGPPLTTLTQEAGLVFLGVYISTIILAGGTANFLLYRRAMAAMQLVAPRAPDPATRLSLLRRVGGVSWVSVAVGFGIITLLQFLSALASGAR
ncbi:MAG TPA: DUF2628 domain-containing protein, partial [Longimicrobiaceae bacterium]